MKTRTLKPEIASVSIEERLDKSIYEAAAQYLSFIDSDEPSDYFDPEAGQAIHKGCVIGEEPFLRIVLLCDARARLEDGPDATDPRPRWASAAGRIFATVDKDQSGRSLNRGFLSDRPSALAFQREVYQEMTSRLVDPQTLIAVDVEGFSDREFAENVANNSIQIEYK